MKLNFDGLEGKEKGWEMMMGDLREGVGLVKRDLVMERGRWWRWGKREKEEVEVESAKVSIVGRRNE